MRSILDKKFTKVWQSLKSIADVKSSPWFKKADTAISCYPNAGLPNPLSPTGFDLEPADMARSLSGFAQDGLLNIAGGCCGNTPEHIAAIAKALEGRPPRNWETASAYESFAPADAEATR